MSDIVDRLEALLEDERIALLAGDFKEVNRIAARKEALVEEARSHPNIPGLLKKLTRNNKRNQALLGAAIEGARAAARRLERLNDVGTHLTTYDSAGQTRKLRTKPGSLERKA